jgi:putative tryptophan/tyrosine transport system substrate-binding protein
MKRRALMLAAAAAALAAGPSLARVAGRPARIAWPASVLVTQWPPYPAFVQAMRERGWIEGTHYIVDAASYEGRTERIPAVVAELLARQPDLIIGSGTPPMRALMQATKTIPIVMFAVGDPEGQGFVASLARPGGNVTGLSSLDHGILARQFELLLQAAPQARRVGVVHNPDIAPHVPGLRDVEVVARRRGVRLHAVAMRTPGEIETTFDALQREQVEAVHFMFQPFLNTGDRAARVAALALQRRWPTALGTATQVRAGILVGYGVSNEDMLRRLPHFVIRILEGTPPAEMPVEQPTRLYTTLNLKTARALGLTLPQSLLLQADEVVE